MNWVATGAFSGGLGIIAVLGFVHGHPIMGGTAVLLGVVWNIVVWTNHGRERTLSGLIVVSAVVSYFALYMEVGVYFVLGAVTLIVIGWEAGLSAREIAPFSKPAQRAFMRSRIPMLTAIAVIGFGVGAVISAVRLHLNFGIALLLSALALVLLVAFLIAVRPGRNNQ